MTTIASNASTLSPMEQDLSAIKIGEWGVREFPLGPRDHPTRRQVIFKQSVLNDIYTHGRGAPDIEVCGVLVGNVYHDAMGPFVFVEANIRGNFSSGKAAQVTFTAKTWAHIQDVMDREYPHLRILGWYHTHPGHGIFLSDMDLFIHKNFFSLPWHLAFVFDPQNQEEGLFAWRTGNMLIESFVVQKDAPQPTPKVARRVPELPPNAPGFGAATHPTVQTTPPAEAKSSLVEERAPEVATPAETYAHAPVQTSAMPSAGPRAMQHAEVTELAMRIQTLEKRQRWYAVAMALIVLVAIAWPVVFSAIAMFQASDESLNAPQPASVGTSSTATAAPAHKNKPVEEAAVRSASAETDPEARP